MFVPSSHCLPAQCTLPTPDIGGLSDYRFQPQDVNMEEDSGVAPMNYTSTACVVLACMLNAFVARAESLQSRDLSVISTNAAAHTRIKFGRLAGTPNGYFDMCAARRDRCQYQSGRFQRAEDGSVRLTASRFAELASINARVNAAISPAPSAMWRAGASKGDCKEFALSKRAQLIAAGWPSSAVPVAIVRTMSGEQHLVLVARTHSGDFILDNLSKTVLLWKDADYRWEKIQSPTSGWEWRTVQTM